MSTFQVVSVRRMVSGAQSIKSGVSFVVGKNVDTGKDLKASFRLDGAHLSETEIVRHLEGLEKSNSVLPVADRTVIRMSLPKMGGAALTISVRPVYTPGALATLLRTLPNIHIESEGKNGKAKKDTAAPATETAPATTPA